MSTSRIAGNLPDTRLSAAHICPLPILRRVRDFSLKQLRAQPKSMARNAACRLFNKAYR
jgi:hypothetical protein